MHFTKMQGLGNDFIVINDMEDKFSDYSSMALRMCDRHFGIGGDGLLVVKKSSVADTKMLIFNSDGSEAEMCGNGIRCFARFVVDNGYVKGGECFIETLDGVKKVNIISEMGKVTGVRVNMGTPKLSHDMIPANINTKDGTIVNESIVVADKKYTITSLSMGVPHTIIFVDDTKNIDAAHIGRQIERCRYFPQGTNVNFANVLDRGRLEVITWERGAGLTLACGTGACASLVAGVLNNKSDRKAQVRLPGGSMLVEWADSGEVYMTGSAEYSFVGEYSYIY